MTLCSCRALLPVLLQKVGGRVIEFAIDSRMILTRI
jgi:hypothetical protein